MFYAAWKDAVNGNINIAVSKNLFKWRKIKKIFLKLVSQSQLYLNLFYLEKRIIFSFLNIKRKQFGISLIKVES